MAVIPLRLDTFVNAPLSPHPSLPLPLPLPLPPPCSPPKLIMKHNQNTLLLSSFL
jgi:hypothetical protein